MLHVYCQGHQDHANLYRHATVQLITGIGRYKSGSRCALFKVRLLVYLILIL